MEIQTSEYPVEMLSVDFQVAGTFSARGQPPLYINDPQVSTLAVEDATLTPLMPGARIGALNVPAMYVPKTTIDVLLIGDFSAEEASLLPNAFRLICFTTAFAVRGTFYGGAETQTADVFESGIGPFVPVVGAEVYPIRPLAVEAGGAAELLYLNRGAIRAYHEIS